MVQLTLFDDDNTKLLKAGFDAHSTRRDYNVNVDLGIGRYCRKIQAKERARSCREKWDFRQLRLHRYRF